VLGKGDGTFQPAVSPDLGLSAEPVSVAAGDFNGDARLDLVLGSGYPHLSDPKTGAANTNPNILVLLGKGDGTFHPSSRFKVFDFPTSMAVGDLNGDGRLDLIIGGHRGSFRKGGISLLLGNGDGSFRTAMTRVSWSVTSVVLGDFNGDSQLDFVTDVYNEIGSPATVWLNTSCPANPRLAVERAGNLLTLSWPSSVGGFVLESSTNLTPASWNLFEPPPVNSNGRWESTVPTVSSQRYFRLRKP